MFFYKHNFYLSLGMYLDNFIRYFWSEIFVALAYFAEFKYSKKNQYIFEHCVLGA